jgi:hypothetical protein
VPNGFDRRAVLQTDRRKYRRITGHGLDRAATAPGNIDKNLGKSTCLEETKTGSVAVTGVFEVQQLMGIFVAEGAYAVQSRLDRS